MDTATNDLEVYLREWVARSSGFFIDSTVEFAPDLTAAPLSAAARRVALPAGEWVLLTRGGEPFVLAGLERRSVDGQDCYVIFEYCVTGDSRVSFWQRLGEGDWAFLRDSRLT